LIQDLPEIDDAGIRKIPDQVRNDVLGTFEIVP